SRSTTVRGGVAELFSRKVSVTESQPVTFREASKGAAGPVSTETGASWGRENFCPTGQKLFVTESRHHS
ncbi:MAG: hypothetical protein WAX57_02110, partial [Minisyncoccia bacterium]